MTISLGRSLSKEKIISIMHTHTMFRKLTIAKNELLEIKTPIMSDHDFIVRLGMILGRNTLSELYGVVTAYMAADIYKLRQEYECLPQGRNGFLPTYSAGSVRIQKGEGRIRYLTPEEIKEIFGEPFPRTSWLWLEDVLKISLGRWNETNRKIEDMTEDKPRKTVPSPRKNTPKKKKMSSD